MLALRIPFFRLIVVCMTSHAFFAGCTNDGPSRAEPSDLRSATANSAEPQPTKDSTVQHPATVNMPLEALATGQNFVVRGVFDFHEPLKTVKLGITAREVTDAIGRPKEVRNKQGPSQWFFTYEFPEWRGHDRWAILMVGFENDDKVSFVSWLPT